MPKDKQLTILFLIFFSGCSYLSENIIFQNPTQFILGIWCNHSFCITTKKEGNFQINHLKNPELVQSGNWTTQSDLLVLKSNHKADFKRIELLTTNRILLKDIKTGDLWNLKKVNQFESKTKHMRFNFFH